MLVLGMVIHHSPHFCTPFFGFVVFPFQDHHFFSFKTPMREGFAVWWCKTSFSLPKNIWNKTQVYPLTYHPTFGKGTSSSNDFWEGISWLSGGYTKHTQRFFKKQLRLPKSGGSSAKLQNLQSTNWKSSQAVHSQMLHGIGILTQPLPLCSCGDVFTQKKGPWKCNSSHIKIGRNRNPKGNSPSDHWFSAAFAVSFRGSTTMWGHHLVTRPEN